jgi:SAM-dependent methyltransferase
MFDDRAPDEQRRLAGIEEIYDPGTVRHLDTIGVGAGWSCLEIGGGSGSVACWLAKRVGPTGSVVVTDLDTRFLTGIDSPQVEVRVHDIRTEPLDRMFDLIHARMVLEHLPERLDVLKKLVAALRPGGWLLIEDGDVTAGRHLPAARQFVVPERLRPHMRHVFEALEALGTPIGFDGEFGRELPRHLVDAGLVNVDAEACSRLITGGSSRSAMYTLTYREIGETYVGTGQISQRELDELIDAYDKPGSMTMSVLMVSAWGRRPA